MSSKSINEIARWMVTVLSGGLGLWIASGLLFQAFHSRSDPFTGYFIAALMLVIVCGPLLLTAYGCLRREYASVIEVWAVIAGGILAGFGLQLVHYFDPLKWVERAAIPSERSADLWTMLGDILALAVASLALFAPFLLGRAVYRFCRRWGYHWFPCRPPIWLRHVG